MASGQSAFYNVSNLIEGRDLAVRIAADRPSHRKAARIVAEVAELLHLAHEKGFVHRDIKPANILLDRRGFGSPSWRRISSGGWGRPRRAPPLSRSN